METWDFCPTAMISDTAMFFTCFSFFYGDCSCGVDKVTILWNGTRYCLGFGILYITIWGGILGFNHFLSFRNAHNACVRFWSCKWTIFDNFSKAILPPQYDFEVFGHRMPWHLSLSALVTRYLVLCSTLPIGFCCGSVSVSFVLVQCCTVQYIQYSLLSLNTSTVQNIHEFIIITGHFKRSNETEWRSGWNGKYKAWARTFSPSVSSLTCQPTSWQRFAIATSVSFVD